jgi:hypothetical protein
MEHSLCATEHSETSKERRHQDSETHDDVLEPGIFFNFFFPPRRTEILHSEKEDCDGDGDVGA